MEFQKIEQFMEVQAVLREGVDFTREELVPDLLTGGALQNLSFEAREAVAKKHGFDGCSWSGSYDEASGTVPMVLRMGIRESAFMGQAPGNRGDVQGSTPADPGESETVEPYLSQMLAQLLRQSQEEPENLEVLGQRDTLLFLHRLYQREEQAAKSRYTRQLMELARQIETDYLEFRVERLEENTVLVTAFDAVRHVDAAKLTFKKYYSYYLMEECKFFW